MTAQRGIEIMEVVSASFFISSIVILIQKPNIVKKKKKKAVLKCRGIFTHCRISSLFCDKKIEHKTYTGRQLRHSLHSPPWSPLSVYICFKKEVNINGDLLPQGNLRLVECNNLNMSCEIMSQVKRIS